MYNNLIEKVKNKFLVAINPALEDDTELIKDYEKQAAELELISDLLNSREGKVLKKKLVNDIIVLVKNLTDTEIGDSKRDSYISDLKAKMDLFNQLSIKDSSEALKETLEELLED